VLSDSDIRVGPAYLRQITAALQAPGIGLVTCLYRGLPVAGTWSRLAAAEIDHRFLPSVLVGLRLGLAKPCFGSTIALRSETLRRIGGFDAFADQLADDYAIGAAVRRLGLKVAIPPMVIDHVCSEENFAELIRRELRWARTIRLVDPLGYMGSVVTHPLPFALAAAVLPGFGAASLAVLALVLACGLLVPLQFARTLGGGRVPVWLTPVRDLLSFAIYLASFLPWSVSWRGHRYKVGPDGTLTQA
jgi:ceramide glucosyltransferase